jgi:hypothetical protein
MSGVRAWLITWWLVILLAAAWLVGSIISAPDVTARCQEDMPCWDCDAMGNRICGTEG